MCCHELRCHLAQAAYLWRLWERRRKTAVTLSEHAELHERSCGTGQRGETLMETAPTLKSPWTHFLSYSSTFTSKAPLRASKQLFQITSSVQFPMNTSDRDRMMVSQRGKAVIQEIKSNHGAQTTVRFSPAGCVPRQRRALPSARVCPPPRMRQPQLPPDRRFFCFFLLPAALALQSTQLVSDRGKLQHKAPSMSSTATRLKGQFPLNGMQQRQSRWHSSATPTISARFYTWSACSRRTMKEGRMKKDILRTVEIFSFYNNYPDGMHTYTTFLT